MKRALPLFCLSLISVFGVGLVGCKSDSGAAKPSEPVAAAAPKEAEGEDGTKILSDTMDRYAAMPSFSAKVESTMSVTGKKTIKTDHTIETQKPNLVAIRYSAIKGEGGEMPAAFFLSDGKQLLEGAGNKAYFYVAPPDIVSSSDSQLMSSSWTHPHPLILMFGGSKVLSIIAKSKPLISGTEKVDGKDATNIRFSAGGMFGSTDIAIDKKTGLILRIRCKMEPVEKQLGTQGLLFEEKFKDVKVGEKIEASHFSTEQPGITDKSPGMLPAGWLKAGMMAPDFEITKLDGSKSRLSSYRGKPVYLDFWATWCGPCKATLPETEKLFLAHGKEINVIAVSSEETAKVKSFIDQKGYKFPVGIDAKNEANMLYGAAAIPMFVVIDKDGKFVGSVTGADIPSAQALLKQIGINVG